VRAIKPNCPLLKRIKNEYKKTKKALKAKMWSDTEYEESDDKYANIYLMAKSYSKEEFEISNFDIPIELSNYIEELLMIIRLCLENTHN